MKGIAVTHVPVRTNRKTRESRLFSGMGAYISRSLVTMFRITIMYQPLKFFWTLSAWFLGTSLILFGRFAWFAAHSTGPSGHVQSVVVAGALAVIGFLLAVFGVLADLTAMNRRLLEEAVLNSRLARLPDPRHGDKRS